MFDEKCIPAATYFVGSGRPRCAITIFKSSHAFTFSPGLRSR